MKGRFYCFTLVIRLNQIEVAPGVYLGEDERGENTLENLVAYRDAIARAVPDAKITIALSHAALSDEDENYRLIRAKVREYHRCYGDDVTYMLGAYFSGAYVPRTEIKKNLDDALRLLRAFMGEEYLPASVVGGFIPASVTEYIASLGIHTVQGNIFSQYAVDNQDGDGSPCYPYYPSKEHFCKPAQSDADFIDAVSLDGWTVDFVNATYAGLTKEGYNSRMGCGPIETLRPFGEEKGIFLMTESAAQMLEESYALNGGFGYATAIWELCLIHPGGYHRMGIDAETVFRFFCSLKKRFPDVRVTTFGEIGALFRAEYKDNSSWSYHFDHRGIGFGGSDENIRIEWYMNRLFRMAIKTDLKTDEKKVIDFTDYTRPAKEPEDSDYSAGIVRRNWSLLGDINQKGLRLQDKPVSFDSLSASQKALIRQAETEYGLHILP